MHGPLELMDMYEKLAATDNVSYVLSDDLRIIRTNAAWNRFALENGGERLLARWRRGSPLMDAIPDPLKPFYLAGFTRACRTGERWEHDYECSSPTAFRRYRMLAYPYGSSLAVTHALLQCEPHPGEPHPPADHYIQDSGITMCAQCRRVRHVSVPGRWDWVPAYVISPPPHVSHRLCPPCHQYYIEEDDRLHRPRYRGDARDRPS